MFYSFVLSRKAFKYFSRVKYSSLEWNKAQLQSNSSKWEDVHQIQDAWMFLNLEWYIGKALFFAVLPQDLICSPGRHLSFVVFLSLFWHVVVHEKMRRNISLTGSLLSPFINHWHGNETVLTKREMDRGIQMQKHYMYIHPFALLVAASHAGISTTGTISESTIRNATKTWSDLKEDKKNLRGLVLHCSVFTGWQLESWFIDSLFKCDKATDLWLLRQWLHLSRVCARFLQSLSKKPHLHGSKIQTYLKFSSHSLPTLSMGKL